MIRKLKNVDTVVHTYYGITIAVGNTYIIEEIDTLVLADDEQLQTDIDDGKIEVYVDTTKVLNTQDAIDVIKYGDVEIKTVGGVTRSFTFDQVRNKWLSTETITIMCSRDYYYTQGYLRAMDGLTLSGYHGFVMPWDGTIVAMSTSRKDTDSDWIMVKINGDSTSAKYETIGLNTYKTNIDQNFDAGDVLTFSVSTGAIDSPIAMAFIKWRKV